MAVLENAVLASQLVEARRMGEETRSTAASAAQEAAREKAVLAAQAADRGEALASSRRDLEAVRQQVASLHGRLVTVATERDRLLAIARDRDTELTAACSELEELHSRRAKDAAVVNEALTQHEELMALTQRLAEGAIGTYRDSPPCLAVKVIFLWRALLLPLPFLRKSHGAQAV
ncbi:uncharacterized protein [Triticum aestivum]|uniref:uncharacterized protein n=1 Tax=Triticum aestivum TaxID=4565 RepID=UPI001D01F879|nr:uncharacterized protein LOC123078868 [Triticum aestivum]